MASVLPEGYFFLSALVCVNVIGLFWDTVSFWTVVSCFLGIATIYTLVYPLGKVLWATSGGCHSIQFKDLKEQLGKDPRVQELVPYCVLNVFWWLITGLAMEIDLGFPNYLLISTVGATLIYLIYYIVMKYRTKEHLTRRVKYYFTLGGVFSVLALIFFFISPTNKANTAYESRDLNMGCLLFGFYDTHDVWHFLSSLGLFFGAMVLLYIDDDRERREEGDL